jgi:hypothetical protein
MLRWRGREGLLLAEGTTGGRRKCRRLDLRHRSLFPTFQVLVLVEVEVSLLLGRQWLAVPVLEDTPATGSALL